MRKHNIRNIRQLKKLVLLLTIILPGQANFAQVVHHFFIEPTASWQVAINPAERLTTDYFRLETKQFIFPKKYAPFDLGLNIGYEFKKQHKLQLEIKRNQSVERVDIYFVSRTDFYNPALSPPVFNPNRTGVQTGLLYSTFTLLYKHLLMDARSPAFNPGTYLKLHLNLGLSYWYNPDNNGKVWVIPFDAAFITSDSTRVFVDGNTYAGLPDFWHSLKFNVGMDFTFGRKNKEFFVLNLGLNYFNQPLLSYTDLTFDVVNKWGITTQTYQYRSRSTGNGIYFVLSKRIYPYAVWEKRKQRKKEKITNCSILNFII